MLPVPVSVAFDWSSLTIDKFTSMKKKPALMSKFRLALQRVASVPKDEVKQLLADERVKRKPHQKSHNSMTSRNTISE